MTLRNVVRYAYAPFLMLGLTGVAYWIVASGHSWWWLAPLLATAYLIAFVSEKIAPFYPEWNDHHSHGDTNANVWHTVIYELSALNGVALIPIIQWMFPYQGIWPSQWPLWGQVLLAFIIADVWFMIIHYWSHKLPVLWRLHAVHHGVGRLYGFNGVIRHPIHQTIDMVIGQAPLVIMGMGQDVAMVLGFLITVTLIVQHSNVDQELGPLDGWLAIGRAHHLHHVNWGTEGDCNFGLFLAVWDRMLGTFNSKPSRAITAADMGVDELPNFPKSYWEQLLLPFYYKPGQGEPERYRKKAPTAAQVDRAHEERMHPAE